MMYSDLKWFYIPREGALTDDNCYWLSSIRKPEKLLTALALEFCVGRDCRLEDVTTEASCWTERPDCASEAGCHLLTGLTLVNANFDFEDGKLLPAQAKRYQQKIPFVKIKFGKNG